MLSSEGNEIGKKKTAIGLISKKATLHVQHTFLYISLPLFWTTATWNVQKRPVYMFYGDSVVRVLAHFFFSLSLSFTLVAASNPAATKFHVVPPTENVSFVFYLSF